MFTRQAPLIANNLWQGGLAQPQANAVTNALGQCNTPLEHRAPVTVDTTAPNMTLINPETTVYNFPTGGMLPPEPKPPRPKYPKRPTPEELPPFEPQPFDPYANPFQTVNNYYNEIYPTKENKIEAKAGKYLRVPARETVELAYKDDQDENICTFDGGEIVGLTKEELIEALDEELRDWFEEEIEEPGTGTTTPVVTGISLSGDTLSISTATIRCLEVNPGGSSDIGVIECS